MVDTNVSKRGHLLNPKQRKAIRDHAEKMFRDLSQCPECGGDVHPDEAACIHCGHMIRETDPPPKANSAPE